MLSINLSVRKELTLNDKAKDNLQAEIRQTIDDSTWIKIQPIGHVFPHAIVSKYYVLSKSIAHHETQNLNYFTKGCDRWNYGSLRPTLHAESF